MAPKQKTFELIPTTVGLQGLGQQQQAQAAPVLSRPPMTTKQAKKLYRKANKGPKLSKAEQRRIELMEQDRIRKEFEKERNQGRARTARDRKKAKQDKEKEDRKRKGLPLVDVHPSQDTISRFVNRAGARRENTEDAESATEAESAIDAGDDDDDEENAIDKENVDPAENPQERGIKRRRLSQHNSGAVQEHEFLARQPLAAPVAAIALESISRAASVDIDDPVTQALLQEQLIEDIVLASSRKTPSSPRVPSPAAEPLPLKVQEPVQSKPLARPYHQVARPQIVRPYLSRHQESNRCNNNNNFTKPASPYLSAGRPKGPVQSPGPPMLPPRFRPPAGPQHYHLGKPKFLPKHLRTPQERPPACQDNDVPTSTQLFLLDHVDDFFPSPSQEVDELLEADKSERKAAVPARASGLGAAPSVPTEVTEPIFDFPISTQDFIFSSQDLRDMETPSKPRRRDQAPSVTGQNTSLQGAGAATTTKTCCHDVHVGPAPASRKQVPGDGHGQPRASINKAGAVERQQGQSMSPPKKRMFGSSGPGAEVLVAMERSYQQSRREARARQEERRAQEGVADSVVKEDGPTTMAASQETDYGDIDLDLALLEDTSWLEDDLDDCL